MYSARDESLTERFVTYKGAELSSHETNMSTENNGRIFKTDLPLFTCETAQLFSQVMLLIIFFAVVYRFTQSLLLCVRMR